MPDFKPEVEVTTTEPKVAVTSPLTSGTYVYQLVVEDTQKNRSTPVQVVVSITAR
jgi:hypothetical protein